MRLLVTCLVLAGAPAWAQTYEIPWWTVDGGGASGASGGVYILAGTVGQPDAGGPLSGGEYSLDGGFWVGVCSYGIDPTSVSVPGEGNSGTVAITTGSGCVWAALSNVAWIQVTAGENGTGNGTVSYAVDANTGGARSGSITIAGRTFTVNQAELQSLSINDVAVTEGNTGTTPATFTVTLSASSTRTVTVHYATIDGEATAPADYAAVSGDLTFAPGVVSQPITVPVRGDLLDEIDEHFTVQLTSPVNARLGQGLGSGTISDDDSIPALSIDDVSIVEG